MKNWQKTKDLILNVPLPVHGSTYTVIPHSVFLNELEDSLNNKGYNIVDQKYLTTHDGNILTGSYKILNRNKGFNESDLSPSITFVNSYNKIRRAEIRACATVLVCKNGMMSTSTNGYYARKHSGTALEDLREHMDMVIDGLEKEFEKLIKNKYEMMRIILSKLQRATIVGDMIVNEKLITPTQLNISLREFERSENFKGHTLWDFYNNITESFKDTHPAWYDRQHIKFHTYISDKFDLFGNNGLYSQAYDGGIRGRIPLKLNEEIIQDFSENLLEME